ncbi:MAG: hypothetical protein EOP04_19480 [Proteobacteria bacterium]|nr:MAG: hypothetical protein EOP04_19480 [Pseudomonadota bacterium]
MKISYSFLLLGLLACNKTENAKLDTNGGAADPRGLSCPEQPVLTPLPFEDETRQSVFQGLGTNCNGLSYVKACPVVSVTKSIPTKKGKTLNFSENFVLERSDPQASTSKTSNAYFFEFKVLQDQTEVSVSIADLKVGSRLELSLVNREQIDSLAGTSIEADEASKKINLPLFDNKVILPAGSYSLVFRSESAEVGDVTITASQEIEDLGIVRAKVFNDYDGCQ